MAVHPYGKHALAAAFPGNGLLTATPGDRSRRSGVQASPKQSVPVGGSRSVAAPQSQLVLGTGIGQRRPFPWRDDLSRLETAVLLELVGGPARGSERPLRELELAELARAGVGELVAERGLGQPGARRLAAAFELGRRLREQRRSPRPSVRSPARVQRLLEDEVRGCEQECFYVLLLDGKHALRRIELVSLGTLTTSLVHPREVFRPAVRAASAAVVCAHNHPSGDPEPSAEDVEVTRRLLESGRLLGVPLLDHVVLGDGRYVSLRERMGF